MRKRIIVLTNRLDLRGNPANGVRVAKAFRELGYNVMIMGHKHLKNDRIHKADMIVASGSLIYKPNIGEAKIISRAKRLDAPFVLWYFDACCPQWKADRKRKYNNICKVIPYLDWLVTTDHSYPWERRIGNYINLMQGVDADEFTIPAPSHNERSYDIIFTGAFSGVHRERQALISGLKKRFNTRTFGTDSGMSAHGDEFLKAHHRARVVYVPPPPQMTPGPYWSNRVYLAAATGTPCVVGYTKGIERHYENNKEVLYFHTANELHARIRRLLGSTDLRKEVGDAARERTLREHTYTNRVKTLMEEVFPNDV